MPERDDAVFAFNSSDADELLVLIGSREQSHSEGRVQPIRGVICKAPGGGIPAISASLVTFVECTVYYRATNTITVTTRTLRVCNMSSQAVTANAYILAVPTNIGYVAIEFC